MKINCSCEGSNPNCYRCYGSGYYDAEEFLFPPTHSTPKTRRPLKAFGSSFIKKNGKSNIDHLIKCTMCSALVRNDRLERHMRKVHDISSARSETNIQPKPNQNIKQTRIKYSNIWFVLHQSGLYNVNQNIIGFRDPSESRMIKRDHIIFYYRSSPYQQIMGIYKVIRSAEGIDKNFRIMTETKSEYLPYQHELELVYPLRRHFGTDEHNRLHFYSRLHNKNRWDNMHVFSMTRGDVELIADQFSNEVLRLLSV